MTVLPIWVRTAARHGAVLLLGLSSSWALAADEVSVTGYATLAAGKAFSGPKQDYYEFHCPCYIANFPDVGIYSDKWSLRPDSRAGLQLAYRPTAAVSLTGQLTMHAAEDQPRVDWAYGSWALEHGLTLQAGRKRLPLFGYSDFFEVGYSYPWIRPPSDLYGWQIVAYNGANLMWQKTLGEATLSTNVWLGTETDKDNQLLGRIYYGDKVEETWKKIVGGYVDLQMDSFSVRVVAMANKVDRWLGSGATRTRNKDNVRQQFYGIAANVDKGNWVVRAELNRFVRPQSPKDIYDSAFVGVGYRVGNFLPMLTYSYFKEDYKEDPTANEKHNTWAATLRWDFRDNMALKFEFDRFKDQSAFPFVGNSKAFAVSLDYIF